MKLEQTKGELTADYPPKGIYDRCVKRFGVNFKKGVLFTYGNKIHAYFPHKVSRDLMAHEQTHVMQQAQHGVEEWWEKYLTDPEFRLLQELEAYRNQYLYTKENYTRPKRRYLLKHFVKALSGKMYGNIISPEEAERVITKDYEKI